MGAKRHRIGERRALGALATLALLVAMLMPAGFMPGTSLAQPIMLCPGQGAMPMMAMANGDHRHRHGQAPHDKADHRCAFADAAAAAVAPAPGPDAPAPDLVAAIAMPSARRDLAPGRGMAAPPPPSHAPPSIRA